MRLELDPLENALSQCQALVKSVDEDRYLAALFAAPEQRAGLCALYAFNHEIAKVRDVISEPMLGEIRLQWWREAIEEIFLGGSVRQNETVEGLAQIVKIYGLDRGKLDALIDARAFDLYDEPMETWDQLVAYLSATAGGLMSLALQITSPGAPVSEEYVRACGIAWGSLGLLRALPLHARRRQMFLPQELLAKHDIELETLLAGKAGLQLTALVGEILDRSKTELRKARQLMSTRPVEALPAVLYVGLSGAYTRKIERAGQDLFTHDLSLSPLRKRMALLRANISGAI